MGILNMIVPPGKLGFLQVRNCNWTTDGALDVSITGRLGTFVLENNVFQNKDRGSNFLSIDDPASKIVWKHNEWKGNYTLAKPMKAEKAILDRNKWPTSGVHITWLNSGTFYHDEDGAWCIPPEEHLDNGTTYVACLNAWFMKSFEMQTHNTGNIVDIVYHPMANAIDDEELPGMWFFRGTHRINFDDREWEPKAMTAMAGSRVVLSGLGMGWNYREVQISAMRNATIELKGLKLTGPDKTIDISASTETSHVFFELCKITQVDIIATGRGHVHIQDSHLKKFVLSAPTIWGSGNILEGGRMVTQPYAGHMLYTALTDTDYHVSPFYLGVEPFYRLRFIRNRWGGTSDLVLAGALSKTIEVDEDIVESPRLARKMAFSPKIRATNLFDFIQRPLLASPPAGHIWPSGNNPQKCPDGTSPGYIDEMGAPTKCLPCAHPDRSKDGLCDNVRQIDLLGNEGPKSSPTPPSMRLGALDLSNLADTSGYRYLSEETIREDCYTCTAMCLGVTREEMDTKQFTLLELLQPASADKSDICTKCALYCADISGCASFCLTFESFLIGLGIALLIIGLPFFCFACICLRSKTIKIKRVQPLDRLCRNGHPVAKKWLYCPQCQEPLDHRLTIVPEIQKKARKRDSTTLIQPSEE